MAWDFTVKITDVAIIVATFMGPIAAVQAQKWLERGRDVKQRRIAIFRALMATRANVLAPAHVEALNSIPIDFFGRSQSLKDVIAAWNVLLDHLNARNPPDMNRWGERRVELFISLLFKISQCLGYEFTELDLKNDFYAPQGHQAVQTDQEVIRRGFAEVFSGAHPFPVEIRNPPGAPAAPAQQRDQ
ncbi:hypothetical protein FAZ95_38310 [Trinickia violacea]|uniref:DUF6680 domain-containing protein n=1 Tax=Trinickia violacea TaxID=2571746 RepID=A0A4P8J1L9_9BURK|nr:DUF6680 family protein [Trinickia violacea]QCP54716.1 hypothetical protein FAZ95_38310 [Trinickia violacea]